MSSSPADPGSSGSHQSLTGDDALHAQEQEGYSKGLTPRQIHMIAIGSSIGTGLFLGAGGGLADAGPTLFILYAVAGFFGYLILRQLGELVVHRPSSGSFVSYTREFYGEKAAYFVGWMYWLSWASTTVVDATAMAIYVKWFGQYSTFIDELPQWVLAGAVLIIVMITNLISVKVFGEMEFWFALIKVSALVIFLVVGVCFVIFGTPTGAPTGFHLIRESGGMLPHGILAALVVSQGVVFAYSGIELVGITAGETRNPERQIPRAINTVILRIALFYVGSVLLLCLLLPYTAYSADESPFVTFFSSIGVDAAGPIMQLVVITAALSSLNAGLYSTGRIMHSMAMAGSAPRFARHLTRSGVPWGGIVLTAAVAMVGVVLNFLVPAQAFEIVLNFASIGIMSTWVAIIACHLRFRSLARAGRYRIPGYRMPGAPFTDWLVLAFLAGVVVLIARDYPVGTWTLGAALLLIPLLILGWFAVRGRVLEIAAQREGYTGLNPVVPQRPAARRSRDAR